MGHFTAIYDSCVLYPAPLRDLLMQLALADLFQAKWTNEIHDEWIRSLLNNRTDLRQEQLERTRRLMNSHVRDCLVSDYADLIPSLVLPDPNDRHVLAAAMRAKASVIVTFNLKHFPEDVTAKLGIAPLHPDEFVANLIDLASSAVCTAARRQRQSLKNPPKTVDEYLSTLQRQGLAQTVTALRCFADLL